MKNKNTPYRLNYLACLSFCLSGFSFIFLLKLECIWFFVPLLGNFLIFQGLCSAKKHTGQMSSEIERMKSQAEQIREHTDLLGLSIQQSKYLALLNQINPHFLYNTLDAIRGDALEMQMTQIADVTEALSTFFRYSVSNMDKLATVEEELGNIADYYVIQKYRFGEKLTMKIVNRDQKDIYQCCLPRMSLQPLIENAISHGLEGREEMGEIIVYLQRTPADLQIFVVDDGVGMSYEQTDLLNERLNSPSVPQENLRESGGGIALTNVNERIRLLFGEPYGLRVFSEEDIGTEVRLTVPALSRGDYEQKRISED